MVRSIGKYQGVFINVQGLISTRAKVEVMRHFEVMVEHVVSPREFVLNDSVTHAHVSGSNPTPMYL